MERKWSGHGAERELAARALICDGSHLGGELGALRGGVEAGEGVAHHGLLVLARRDDPELLGVTQHAERERRAAAGAARSIPDGMHLPRERKSASRGSKARIQTGGV